MERTFRPKGTSVKAVQVTDETIDYAVEWCAGGKSHTDDSELVVLVPTLNGVKNANNGDYVVRIKGEGFKVMTAEDFEDRYEPVRTTRSDRDG